jgi:hypothetical protein
LVELIKAQRASSSVMVAGLNDDGDTLGAQEGLDDGDTLGQLLGTTLGAQLGTLVVTLLGLGVVEGAEATDVGRAIFLIRRL